MVVARWRGPKIQAAKRASRRKQTFLWMVWQSPTPIGALGATADHLSACLLGLLPVMGAYKVLLLPQNYTAELEAFGK